MRPLGWNVDSKDFEGGSVQAIEATVRGELSKGRRSCSTTAVATVP